jgi:hypothetical protein
MQGLAAPKKYLNAENDGLSVQWALGYQIFFQDDLVSVSHTRLVRTELPAPVALCLWLYQCLHLHGRIFKFRHHRCARLYAVQDRP